MMLPIIIAIVKQLSKLDKKFSVKPNPLSVHKSTDGFTKHDEFFIKILKLKTVIKKRNTLN